MHYSYRQCILTLRQKSKLSEQQKISRQKNAAQKPLEKKIVTTFMRKGSPLTIAKELNRWWIESYRIKFRSDIRRTKNLLIEELERQDEDKSQYMDFLRNDFHAWSPGEILEFRLRTLPSIFYLKPYHWQASRSWRVVYIAPKMRLANTYAGFLKQLRISRLLNKNFRKTLDATITKFIEENDTKQELFDFKIQAYRQFLF